MTDWIDRAQELQLRAIEDALAARTAAPAAGRETCANLDCGEPISPQRQALGARLCLDCQRAEEHRDMTRRHR